MKVSVLGIGHVGSVAAAGLASAGHDVLAIDTDLSKIVGFREGTLSIQEPGLDELIDPSLKRGNLRFMHTTEVEEQLGEAIIVATGTPMLPNGAADLGQVRSALSWIREAQLD